MKLRAPAKVNLQLRILGRREDGFHDIETLMVPISLADEITIETAIGRTVKVRSNDPTLPTGDSNLAVKAAQIFSEATGLKFAAHIEIEKRVPMGAGLGGGSSDAAAVLVALDTLFETHMSAPDLEQLASRIGSDIPFFIRTLPAWCRGRGEIIEPTEIPETLPLLLIKPPFGVPTPWAYKNWRDSQSLPGEWETDVDLGWIRIVNSLERPVFEKFLFLPILRRWLTEQPEVRAAAMSGSGSTVFAILKDAIDGPALEARVKEYFGGNLWTALCHTGAE